MPFPRSGGGSGGVTSVFTRTGAVTATSGDYTAAQVTNAADKSAAGAQDFTGEVSAPDLEANGLTGAASPTRVVGSNATGSPATGTFEVADFAPSGDGVAWICTSAGSPGLWNQPVNSFNTRHGNVSLTEADVTATFAAKGGIRVGTGAATGTELAVGSNTQILTADSTQASGVKWAAPAATYSPQVPQRFTASGTFTPGTSGNQWFSFGLIGGGAGGGAGGSTGGGGGGGGGAVQEGFANITSAVTVTIGASASAGSVGNVTKLTVGLVTSTVGAPTAGAAGGTGQGNGGQGGDGSRGALASTVTTSDQQHGLGLSGGGAGAGAATNNAGIGAPGRAFYNPDGVTTVPSYGCGGSGGAALGNTGGAGTGLSPGNGGAGATAGGGGGAGFRNGSAAVTTTGGNGGSNTANNSGIGGGGGGAGTVAGAGGAGDNGYAWFQQIA